MNPITIKWPKIESMHTKLNGYKELRCIFSLTNLQVASHALIVFWLAACILAIDRFIKIVSKKE